MKNGGPSSRDVARMEKQGPRILLVDDEEPVSRVLDVALESAGYTMYQVGNGRETQGRSRRVPPALCRSSMYALTLQTLRQIADFSCATQCLA